MQPRWNNVPGWLMVLTSASCSISVTSRCASTSAWDSWPIRARVASTCFSEWSATTTGAAASRELAYSAHPSALEQLRQIAYEVAAGVPVVAVAAIHRVGELAIGDAAVIVAVSAVHRGEAFEACRLLIDRLKHEVPIWKHQTFTDGTAEWVAAC